MTKPSKGVVVRDTTVPATADNLATIPPTLSGADKITQTAELLEACIQIAKAVAPTAMMPAHLRNRPEEAAYRIIRPDGERITSGSFEYG